LHGLVKVLVDEMSAAYPELRTGHDAITEVVRAEEERFDAVLTDGLPRLETALGGVTDGTLGGDEVFRLYDTYGLPLDFIEDLASEHHIAVDRTGFDQALETQRTQSRAKTRFGVAAATDYVFASADDRSGILAAPDIFEGYTVTRVDDTRVLAMFDDTRKAVDTLGPSTAGYVVLVETPFYREAGGQVSDTGTLTTAGGMTATVDAVERLTPSGPRAHHVSVTQGPLGAGDVVTATVDVERRDAIRRNHTATHLLHAALREHLGPHVKQAGSLVAPDRLRFDFAHGGPIERKVLDTIEQDVNAQVYGNHTVRTDVRTTQEAIDDGAMALFGEKYGETVRVVTIPDVSMELCGGTHCRATGDIGLFAITQETGVAAGVRRIEAVTGAGAVSHVQTQRASASAVLTALGVPSARAVETVERLQGDTKRLAREIEQLKMKSALGASPDTGDEGAVRIGDAQFIARRVSGLEKASLRGLADSLRDRLGRGVVVLASDNGGKVALIVSVSKDLTNRVHAGKVVKAIAPIVGGGGGGRADFAEAGGRQPAQIDALLAESHTVVASMLNVPSPSETGKA
ncbi:MAG: alanine--tRNA ligase-related protein, partial [Acidobacteriota bacterium]|nr:alanine--tRNA ligase-related protein [Acidobacteriota bacterium]